MKEEYRIGKRVGQDRWQIKQGSGSWRVVHQCDTLAEAAKFLTERSVDIRLVPVLQGYPWKTLGQIIAEQSADAKCPKCGMTFDPAIHAVYECPRCNLPGSTACCNPGGNNCICQQCEEES
ncbi:MAG: hypothetical protein NT105_23775 [Verrucomicrobia bacterium]|nr:hypothetical protein [Verrucomicrobiota bacterium]